MNQKSPGRGSQAPAKKSALPPARLGLMVIVVVIVATWVGSSLGVVL